MVKYIAHIESNGKGWFSVYTKNEFPFGVIGEGATIEDAKKDFIAVFKEMSQKHKTRTGEDVNGDFSFVMDTSAILQESKKYISFSVLAKLTGISESQISQYACGTRKPKQQQRERIIEGIHAIGQKCLSLF